MDQLLKQCQRLIRDGCALERRTFRSFVQQSSGSAHPSRLLRHKRRGLLLSRDRRRVRFDAPQPRAVLRLVDPKDTARTVDYGEFGRVELTTLTKEFFMPRFLERDEAIRRPPTERYPWDGVGDVRPFGVMEKKIVEGVY